MKRLSYILSFCAIALMAASCSTTVPLTMTDNEISSDYTRGVSVNSCLFPSGGYYMQASSETNSLVSPVGLFITSSGICFNKDYGIYEAAEDAGIDKVATVDLKRTNYFGIFMKYELIVTGE